jgi:hypothetical protein
MKWENEEFDFKEGERRRDEGMSRTRGSQGNFGFNYAASQFFFALKVGDVFTPDDVVRYAGLPDEGINKNNAVGAWISGLAHGGFIRWTGRTVKSERVDRHAGSNKEWVKIKG